MVRVISVHHFTRQDVTGLDRAGGHGVTRGKDNLIFIGGQHKIDIYDLKQGASIKGNFPTVDLVQQLVYCKKGNYVCTLENKPARHGGDHFYVRVYLNWEKESNDQPMKARIAGRVTPGSQSLDVLEMVEIPTKRPTDFIACCQSTGNIAMASGITISIFKYCLKTHDISKIKFVDFDEILEIEAAFIVKEVAIAEDIVGLVSETEAHIIQVVINSAILNSATEGISEEANIPVRRSKSRSKSKTRSNSKSPGRASECSMTPFRGKKVTLKESKMQLIRKANNYINLSEMKWTPTLSYGKRKNDINDAYLLFPSLVGASQCGVVTEPGETFGPVSSNRCSNVRIKLLSGHGASQRVSSGIFEGISLIHRKIDHLTEPDLPFSNLHMNCIYNDYNEESSTSPRNSTHPLLPVNGGKGSQKTGLSVFVTTPHVGHLYHISLASNPMESTIVRGGVFSYTAPVDTVALEPCLLHALTLTGLETYTLRPHPQVIETVLPGDHEMIVPPHWEESVCLVGLRPFLNVESLTLTDSCLALIAANDEGGDKSHTTYSLHLPSAANLYKEMIRVGLSHRAASPSTYFHLLLEAHIVLLTAIKCQKNQEDLRMIPEEDDSEDLVSLLQDSSALLADYYASCTSESEWQQAVQYYRCSTLSPDAILERLLPSRSPGLVSIILSLLFITNAPILNAIQANCILDAFEQIAPEKVSNMLLKANCMKEYKKDKALNIIKQELSKSAEPNPSDVLALCLIVQGKGSADKVNSILALLKSHKLVEILLQHSRLLVDREENQLKLSPLSQTLLEHKKEVFIEVFVLLIGEGTFSLNALVDAFVSVYPIVSCGIECNVNSLRLRDLIENFFLEFGHLPELTVQREKYEKAVDVLISLYVASLLGAFNLGGEQDKNSVEQRSVWINLYGERPSYLNYFSPFHGKPPPTTCKLLSTTTEEGEEDAKISPGEDCNCQQCSVHLLLLQSLLNSDLPSVENKSTILKVVTSHPEIKGSSSLRVLCLDSHQKISYIIENHPNALIHYCKDTYESPYEWEHVVKELITKVTETPKEEPAHEILDVTLNEILGELVMTSSFEDFTTIVPIEFHGQFRSHIRQCHSAGIAKFLKETFITYADNVLQQAIAEA